MQTIAIANDKGGVAKTTTAISLGGALVELGNEVLLIDLDPQASLTLALGYPPHQMRRSVADVLLNTLSPVSVSKETCIPGLDLLPSNADMELAERFLPIRKNYTQLFRQAVEKINFYDTLIIDCPPAMGAITQSALVASDLLIIPTTPEYLSVYSLRNVIRLINKVRKEDNANLMYRLLITMLDQRISSHNTLSEQLRETFGTTVFKTEIQVDTKLRDSTIAGKPITHYAGKTRSAQQYRALAQEINNYVRAE